MRLRVYVSPTICLHTHTHIFSLFTIVVVAFACGTDSSLDYYTYSRRPLPVPYQGEECIVHIGCGKRFRSAQCVHFQAAADEIETDDRSGICEIVGREKRAFAYHVHFCEQPDDKKVRPSRLQLNLKCLHPFSVLCAHVGLPTFFLRTDTFMRVPEELGELLAWNRFANR